MGRTLTSIAFALASACASAWVMGCTPSIGDKCFLSTDCSLQGDRLCDTSQPDGYCTVFNCTGNTCPDDAACVLFHANTPGCPYDDRAGSRTGRAFCITWCSSNSDCRAGYVCTDPRRAPWSAAILDDNQTKLGCMVIPDTAGNSSSTPAPVCRSAGPAVPPIDASPPAIAAEAGVDAGVDAGLDAGADASDAGDASDAADAADAPDSG